MSNGNTSNTVLPNWYIGPSIEALRVRLDTAIASAEHSAKRGRAKWVARYTARADEIRAQIAIAEKAVRS